MTEAEWLNCCDPRLMLKSLWGKASDRKLRLFAVACCRLVWHLLIDERSRVAVEAAERFSDGLLADSDREAAFSSACAALRGLYRSPDAYPETVLRLRHQHHSHKLQRASFLAAFAVGAGAGDIQAHIRGVEHCLVDAVVQSRLLCDVFGNFFRQISFDPLLAHARVVALTQAIYGDRSFDRMPELADALEEAGCTDSEIMGHCRSVRPHVRGCWVVDMILGIE